MASLIKDQGGKKRIAFVDHNGNRKQIRIGKCSVRDAESFKTRLESLLSAKIQGVEPSRLDAEWLNEISPVLRDKLVKVELCRPLEIEGNPTVSKWITDYMDSRTDVKESTVKTWNSAANNLRGFAGDKQVKDFTAFDAQNFRSYLIE